MQLVILSGKGGTGKTTIAASLSYLAKGSIKVDCDVDAPNLNIVIQGNEKEKSWFSGAKKARIDAKRCIKCGQCVKVCRYQAIEDYCINELKCEGCAACTAICRHGAIILENVKTADLYIKETSNGILSCAEMEVGAEGSGKLVTEVRKNALRYYGEGQIMILDGSPGIGCAVMASVTGCDAALLVVEPTLSGLSDFLRVLEICRYFGVKIYVCINKYDVNQEITNDIEKFCLKSGINVIARIPFDDAVRKAANAKKTVVSYEGSPASMEINRMWYRILSDIKEGFINENSYS